MIGLCGVQSKLFCTFNLPLFMQEGKIGTSLTYQDSSKWCENYIWNSNFPLIDKWEHRQKFTFFIMCIQRECWGKEAQSWQLRVMVGKIAIWLHLLFRAFFFIWCLLIFFLFYNEIDFWDPRKDMVFLKEAHTTQIDQVILNN